MEELKRLLTFAGNFDMRNIDKGVVERAKLILLDSLGGIIYGNQTEEVFNLAKLNDSPTGIPILGTPFRASSHMATLINAQGMVSQELDEGNTYAKGHPASHILPALLSVSDQKEISGSKFLESFITGYEVATRLGYAVQLKPAIHPHGNWGMVGGGVAIGRLLDFSGGQIERAIALSASLPMVSLWENALHGHRVRDIYIGMINVMNTMIPDLVAAGYTASLDGFKTIYDGILGEKLAMEKALENLGTEYFLMKNYFKRFSYCRYCHSPIEALQAIIEREPFEFKRIERINVYTYRIASQLNRQNVENEFAVKFSIPAALGDWLAKQGGNIDAKEIAKKVFVFDDPEINKRLPDERNSRVEVILNDGTRYSEYRVGAKGDHHNPFSEEEIKQKLIDFTSPIIGKANCLQLIDACFTIETKTVKDIVRLCIKN
jgi:2-methylcitrate dehydratase PrpD